MLNVCIDVDLTLIDENGELLPGAIEALHKLRDFPCRITLWSAAGAEYSRSVAARHKLEHFFEGFAGKPDLAIDDDPQSLILKKLILKDPARTWNNVQAEALVELKKIEEERE
jgi:phosphoglycolate phosphatase-like HAD superfamily hydrolase